MDIEGWAIAHRLADHGVAAFVLKYRTRPTSPDENAFTAALNQEISQQNSDKPAAPDTDMPVASTEAIAALEMVRANSTKWAIDPRRVGMIGLSAGATTTMDTVLNASAANRPNFFGYIYGPDGFGHGNITLRTYEMGGHAFGTGLPGTTSLLVMPEFYAWMQSDGFIRQN